MICSSCGSGQMSVEEALEKSQAATDRIMRQAGYY